ncbi:putative fatty acyl-CoA reductase CG5065 [Uranotaenia lowii]|uniref:putative fatty acyl-CoA reductase CG5065 n=1 Tax=Uranotaenia lowii TaxID=190385 RepID=UPI00247A611F|nr:putative fatty acyl-CoA reductase CG5065 [Uranotaenia lowii]
MSVLSNMSSSPTIPETFAGADVFVTGGSGFMGKILLEKLLRSCPDVGKVFVLMRPHRGASESERISQLVQLPLFDKLRASHPESFGKLIPINGDCSEKRLGMDDASFGRLVDVQFVFHAAASVRFDDSLQKAILMNTRSTRDILEWASTLKKLRAFVHVSTMYCNVDHTTVEMVEELGRAKMDWKLAIDAAEQLDVEMLETLAPKLMNGTMNTYLFTKALAEHICHDYSRKLPLVIYRPSLVVCCEKEPLPGWVDNFNGHVGLLLAFTTGILRTVYFDPKGTIDIIPADMCIKTILIAAWLRATNSEHSRLIYNGAVERRKTCTYSDSFPMEKLLHRMYPPSQLVWFPNITFAHCIYEYYLYFLLFQILPSMMVDSILRIKNQRPRLMKIQRVIFSLTLSVLPVAFNNWTFRADNFKMLENVIHPTDREQFDLAHIQSGMFEFGKICHLGGRRYLVKESDDTVPSARRISQRLERMDRIVSWIFYAVFWYLMYRLVF